MSSRDNWERLVAAVLKREQIWQLCHEHSRSPSISTMSSDVSSDFSEQIINFSSNNLETISVSPPPPLPLTNPFVPQVGGKATGPIIRKVFFAPATALARYRRRKPRDRNLVDIPDEEDPETDTRQIRRFSLRELQLATDNFSNKNVLNEFRNVYKGQLVDGSLVAVKRIDHKDNQVTELQFQREVEMISKVVHSNLVCLLGFCTTRKERMLVYPLMVNGSVARYSRVQPELQFPLGWPIRKHIALGSAKGLAYLHNKCDPEITSERGTIDRLAPEYLNCSEKTDVFSYGVLLLELITGQSALDLTRLANEDNMLLLNWVKRKLAEENKWKIIVEADSRGNHMEEVGEQLMQIALLCLESMPEGRPRMSQIVTMLECDGLADIISDDTFNIPQDELSGPRCVRYMLF